jgi:hypothetical protein
MLPHISPDGRCSWDEQTRQWVPIPPGVWNPAPPRHSALWSVLVTCAVFVGVLILLALGLAACAKAMGPNPFATGMLPVMGRA